MIKNNNLYSMMNNIKDSFDSCDYNKYSNLSNLPEELNKNTKRLLNIYIQRILGKKKTSVQDSKLICDIIQKYNKDSLIFYSILIEIIDKIYLYGYNEKIIEKIKNLNIVLINDYIDLYIKNNIKNNSILASAPSSATVSSSSSSSALASSLALAPTPATVSSSSSSSALASSLAPTPATVSSERILAPSPEPKTLATVSLSPASPAPAPEIEPANTAAIKPANTEAKAENKKRANAEKVAKAVKNSIYYTNIKGGKYSAIIIEEDKSNNIIKAQKLDSKSIPDTIIYLMRRDNNYYEYKTSLGKNKSGSDIINNKDLKVYNNPQKNKKVDVKYITKDNKINGALKENEIFPNIFVASPIIPLTKYPGYSQTYNFSKNTILLKKVNDIYYELFIKIPETLSKPSTSSTSAPSTSSTSAPSTSSKAPPSTSPKNTNITYMNEGTAFNAKIIEKNTEYNIIKAEKDSEVIYLKQKEKKYFKYKTRTGIDATNESNLDTRNKTEIVKRNSIDKCKYITKDNKKNIAYIKKNIFENIFVAYPVVSGYTKYYFSENSILLKKDGTVYYELF